MRENGRIEVAGKFVTRGELRKLGPETIERCKNHFPPGRDQAILVAYYEQFRDELALTYRELRAVEVGRNLAFVSTSRTERGPSPYDEAIVAAEGALTTAESAARAALEEVVKARKAIAKERGKKKIIRSRLEATFIEDVQASDLYKDLNRASVRCRAKLNNLRLARDRWHALRQYEREQAK